MEMLSNVWYVIIGFCIIMYVLLDGFDLGIGLLFPFFNDKEKSILMSTILPVWDGNQTWLVLGIACFYGAFPMAFSLVMPALYLPLLIMVISLLLRGITFEFRLKEKHITWVWNFIFFASSFVVTMCQGVLLGSFVVGFDVDVVDRHHLIFSALTPFNFVCGIAMLFGYILLGSTWAIAKTTNTLQKKMYPFALVALCGIAFFLALISAWTPFINAEIFDRWFNPNHIFKLMPLPMITGLLILYLAWCIRQHYEYILYWLSVLIFVCSYIGFGISTWPYIIPRQVDMWQASAPPSSQLFMLIGTLLLLPVLLGYTSYAYYIFREKVTQSIDY